MFIPSLFLQQEKMEVGPSVLERTRKLLRLKPDLLSYAGRIICLASWQGVCVCVCVRTASSIRTENNPTINALYLTRSLTIAHKIAHSLMHSLSRSLIHLLAHSFTNLLPCSLTHSLIYSFTQLLNLPLARSLTHLIAHSLT